MGWIAINILLPVMAPLLLVLVAGKICAPLGSFASRLRIIRALKDGQFGWLSVAYSASAAYEIYGHAQKCVLPAWAGPALASCIALLMLSGMIAVFGATFPVRIRNQFRSKIDWLVHYRLFASSVVLLIFSAISLGMAHFALGLACN